MKVKKTMTYALTCIRELDVQFGGYVQVADIAKKHDLPAAYCQKILRMLAQAGIVESVKGQGFSLLRPVNEISEHRVSQALLPESKNQVWAN